MKKKFKDLAPEDFPGVDQIKFYEWKKARNASIRNVWIGLAVLITIGILAQLKVLHFGGIEYLILALCFVFLNPLMFSKYNKLSKELKLSSQLVRKALKGE
jgi:hypothetical protein